MTKEQMTRLQNGDIVRNLDSGIAYIIVRNWNGFEAIAIRSISVTNPSEWMMVSESNPREERP